MLLCPCAHKCKDCNFHLTSNLDYKILYHQGVWLCIKVKKFTCKFAKHYFQYNVLPTKLEFLEREF